MRKALPFALAFLFIASSARAYNEEPALTGDVTKPAGSTVTTVTGINGAAVPASAPLLSSNSSGQPLSVSTVAPINGGSGQVPGLIFNSASAASANSTAINIALTAGGKVEIACPSASTVIYISSTLIVPSNTEFKVDPSCTLTASGNMSPMIANRAASASWQVLWSGSGVQTSAPLSIIRETDVSGWGTSHGYSKGAYALANGNVYWCATAGTSASSGSGPTGTGTSITDGTALWNYVSTYTSTTYSYPTTLLGDPGLLAIVTIPNHGLSLGSAVWLNPQGDTPAGSAPYYWSGTKTAPATGGLADSAYFGVFPIVNVNDTNHVTVLLRRAPSAAFSGVPMLEKTADQNIVIDVEGVSNYNYPTNSQGGNVFGTPPGYNLNMAGVMALTVKNFVGQNTYGFTSNFNAIERGDIGHIHVINGYADAVKGYGPLFDTTIHDVDGSSYTYQTNGDDFVSYNTEDYDGTRTISVGDVLNVAVSNVVSYGGLRVGAWMQQPYLYMDNLDFSRITSATPVGLVGSGVVSIYNQGGGGATSGGNIGTLRVHDIFYRGSNNLGGVAYSILNIYSPSTTIGSLVVDNIDLGTQAGFSFSGVVVNQGTVNKLDVSHMVGSLGQYGSVAYVGSGATAKSINIENSSIAFTNNTAAVTGSASGTGVLDYNIANNYLTGTGGCLVNDSDAARITLLGNVAPSQIAALVCASTSNTVYAANNYVPSSTGGLLNATAGSLTPTVTSGGGNNFGSAAWFTGSAQTDTVYGWDIKCDVTKVSRTTGEYCYNTDAAPGSGTLTTAGPVMDQGTTSNSWFLLSNPTGQQY